MNFSWTTFGVILILHVRKISAEKEYAIRNSYKGPLALLQEYESTELKLAIPRRIDNHKRVAEYPYDKEGRNGPAEVFKTACPADTPDQLNIETEWRKKANASNRSKLFFLKQYTNYNMECPINEKPGPSIQKTERDCGKSQGVIYEVGYPVSNEDGSNIQFMAVYEMCYSNDKKNPAMIYTKHHINSPSLMLLYIENDYEPYVLTSFTSPLDGKLKKIDEFYKKEGGYRYQFVPRYDMPTVLLENTTLFPFNYTPLGGYRSTLRHMMKYDNVVREFSKKENKPLTIYSGIYQLTVFKDGVKCFRACKVPVPINSFWRVLIDEEKQATVLITQYTKMECGEGIHQYMCDKKSVLIIEHYSYGGCTYQCPLTRALIDALRLPEIEFGEDLVIKYTKTAPPESEITPEGVSPVPVGGQSDANAQSSSTHVSITDFSEGATFVAAVAIVDAAASIAMQADGAIDAGNGLSNADGTDGATEGGGHGADHGGSGDTGGGGEGGGGGGGGGGEGGGGG